MWHSRIRPSCSACAKWALSQSPLTVAAFDDFIRHDAGRWAELVKISGAKAE